MQQTPACTPAIPAPQAPSYRSARPVVRAPSPLLGLQPPVVLSAQRPVNTAKLSPILLNRTSRLSFAGDPRPHRLSVSSATMPFDAKEARRRRSSSLVYTEPPESLEQLSDQAALPNLNAEWVNAKGAYLEPLPIFSSCSDIAAGLCQIPIPKPPETKKLIS